MSWIEDFIASFGYLGLAALMLAENLFPPIPSEAVLPLAGFFVGRGELSFLPALAAATLGSLAGAVVLYALGRWGGRALVLRHGRLLRVKEKDLDRAERWFEKHGDVVVLAARVVPFARSVVSVPAGVLEMPFWRFTLLSAAGTCVWNTLLIGAGWYLGDNWQRISSVVGSVSEVVVIVLAVATIAFAIHWWRSR